MTNAELLTVVMLGPWTADRFAEAAPTLALYAGVIVSLVTASASVLVNRRTSRATARSVEIDASAKGVQSLVQALDRAETEREDADRREAAAIQREHDALDREAKAVATARELQGELDLCVRKAETLQRRLDEMGRTVTRLQDLVEARDETIVNQAATIRALRGSNGNGNGNGNGS